VPNREELDNQIYKLAKDVADGDERIEVRIYFVKVQGD
jgi:hypothetical protein